MSGFVGRSAELAELAEYLQLTQEGSRAERGLALLLRGRRRVGKSRLVTEFLARSSVPSVFFQAARFAPPREELDRLARAVEESTLPLAPAARGWHPSTLDEALSLLAGILPDDQASVVVLDEVPWLLESFAGGAGQLQRVWDRELSRKPVLLIMLGSDLGIMEAINAYDQPFHGRARQMLLGPLTPKETGEMVGASGAAVFDAYLATGGFPAVAEDWRDGESFEDFVSRSFARVNTPLAISGRLVLDDEFPAATQARAVLTAIGGRGERTFTAIRDSCSGVVSPTALTRALDTLTAKRVIVADEPLSTRKAPKDRRWRVADPSLRFWLALVEPGLADIERGRPDLAIDRFTRGYPAWRGRAIEPVVRHALLGLLIGDDPLAVGEVGGWWPRTNNPEIDLVGTDARPAHHVRFVGSIKWRMDRRVSQEDIAQLRASSRVVPGVDEATALVAVCPAGAEPGTGASRIWTAEDLLAGR